MELYIWRSFSNGANGTAASVAVMLLGMASVLIGLAVGAAEGGRRVRAGAGGRLVGLVGRHAFLIVICLAALYPLWFIVSRFQVERRLPTRPHRLSFHPTLDSLRTMVSDEPLPRWMWNSFRHRLVRRRLDAGRAARRLCGRVRRFRGHKIFLSTSVALMVVPPVTLLVPMFVFMVDTGWVNHLQSVIVFYTGLLVPFGVFFLANFFRTVPEELIEAASVEGRPFTVLRRVVLPLSGRQPSRSSSSSRSGCGTSC